MLECGQTDLFSVLIYLNNFTEKTYVFFLSLISHLFLLAIKLRFSHIIVLTDILIEKFEEALLAGATSGHLLQYEMDDGQMKVRVQYRNVRDMTEAMNGLIKMRQYYVNKANGRSTRMVGGNL